MVKVILNKDEVFESVKVVLETQEEIELLWHAMNCGEGNSLQNYCKDRNILSNGMSEFKERVFGKLSEFTK